MRPDFLLGTNESAQPVHIPDAIRCEHVTVVGATGTGKTTLLERLILADIENETSCALIDAHGDLTESILRKTFESAKERVHLLEISEDRPFGLNLLERLPRESIDLVASEVLLVFKRMFEGESEFRPQLDNDLDLIIRTLLANDGYTLAEALELLHNKPFRDRLTSRLTNRAQLMAWAEYDALSPRDRSARNAALLNRLNPFLGSDRIRNIVGQAKTTVPLKWAMDTPGQALLIKLPIGGQGSEQESKFLGNLFVCQLARLIFGRAGSSARNRFHLYLDEYGRYATPTTARLFTDIRKYQVGLTVAHQAMTDVGDERQKTAELQAGTLVCFHPASGSDADELAGSMPVIPRPADEAPRAVSLTPVRQLLEGRHDSDAVQAITRRLLAPLQELIDSGSHIGEEWHHVRGFDPFPGYALRHDELQEGMKLVNDLLVDVMKSEAVPGSHEFVSRFAAIISGLKFYVGADWAAGSAEAICKATQERLAIIDSMSVAPKIDPAERRDVRSAVSPTPWDSMGFMGDLYSLCKLIADSPLYVSLPGYQARSQQTYADARAELADQIKRLPKHHAYVKLRTPDGVRVTHVHLHAPIEPLDFLPSDEEITNNIVYREKWVPWLYLHSSIRDKLREAAGLKNDVPPHLRLRTMEDAFPHRLATQKLRKRCSKNFGTPREEVEREIWRRQGRGDEGDAGHPTGEPKGPPPVAPPPPIGRRSPKKRG